MTQSSPPITNPQKDSIPLIGSIAAGTPIWAEQNFEGHLPINLNLFGRGELFALHVHGDSMTGAGIRNGDIAVIKRQSIVDNGEIAAVLIEQAATLKRVYLSSNALVLKADNPVFDDLKYSKGQSDSVRILGRYVGLVRTGNIRCGS